MNIFNSTNKNTEIRDKIVYIVVYSVVTVVLLGGLYYAVVTAHKVDTKIMYLKEDIKRENEKTKDKNIDVDADIDELKKRINKLEEEIRIIKNEQINDMKKFIDKITLETKKNEDAIKKAGVGG
jgi:septal ring factor EnvC (AmiA/AmiB activator)